jgi:DNA-binding NarL/FixJ family response regulator
MTAQSQPLPSLRKSAKNDGLTEYFSLAILRGPGHTRVMTITVLVLEDDDFTRATLSGSLTLGGFDVVAQCKTAAEAVAENRNRQPQVALLDLDLGRGPTGLDVARSLRRENPHIGIVFLTSYQDPRLIATPGQMPPSGSQYLVKKNVGSTEVIFDAIKLALESKKVSRWVGSSDNDFGHLTQSQIGTLRHVAEGLSNAEIARKLSITERAVEQKIARIAKKLGIEREVDRNLRVSIARAYFRQLGTWSDGTH